MPDFALLDRLDVRLDALAQERLSAFHVLLMEKNRVMDLTRVPEEEMTLRHYADCLMVIPRGLIPAGASAIDVGSGAGFPGIPLAIAMPELRMTLLEAQEKRCAFLRDAALCLGLGNVQVVRGRAEDLAFTAHREDHDLALARAVAPLNVLVEYLLPFLRPGGRALCWKGPSIQEEMAAGRAAAAELGGRLDGLTDLGIPGRTSLVLAVEKTGSTPPGFPRKAGLPAKYPLGLK